jgi:hypothetical protein
VWRRSLRSRPLSTLTRWCGAHGQAGWAARLILLTVDGLIYASSMVMLDSARRKVPVPALALPGASSVSDPLQAHAVRMFAGDLAARRVPSIRALVALEARAVGQDVVELAEPGG